MVTLFNPDAVFAFKNYVFNKIDPKNEKIKAIAGNPLEVSVEKYLHEHLKPQDAENLLRFKEGFLQYCSAKDLSVALLAVGSSTYPLALMGKPAHYHDIDILVLATQEEDVRFPVKKGMYESRLVKIITNYIRAAARNQGYTPSSADVLNILEVSDRRARIVDYGRPNTELRHQDFSSIHLIAEIYEPKTFDAEKRGEEEMAALTTPIASRIIPRQRRKNLPLVVLHE